MTIKIPLGRAKRLKRAKARHELEERKRKAKEKGLLVYKTRRIPRF